MKARTTVAAIIVMMAGAASGLELERWACVDESGHTTIWTIMEDRMLATKGTIALKVIANGPSVAVAYHLAKSKNDVISIVHVLDKIAGKLILYNDMDAVLFKGKFYQPFEPEVEKHACRLSKQ